MNCWMYKEESKIIKAVTAVDWAALRVRWLTRIQPIVTTIKDKVYVLNPGYQLRNDVHRVALFAKVGSGGSCSKDWHTFIHPVQAAMLSFFTCNRSLDENLLNLSRFFSRDIGYMEKIVSAYIENPTQVYTLWEEQRICFPKNVLIELEEAGKEYHFQELTTD